MLKKLLIRLGLAALSVAITLTWWTLRKGDSHAQSSNSIPAEVWGGGPTKITVEAESSTTATMRISFSDHSRPAGEQPMLETYEKMPVGARSWSVNVPDQVGRYLELGADHPKAGDTLKWRVLINGSVVNEDTQSLEKELAPNTAFFLQLYYDEYAKAREENHESGSE
jgi:hypothetical protein